MCLDAITSTTRDRKREGFGWKVFNACEGVLYGEFYGGNGCFKQKESPFREGVWLKSKDNHTKEYPLGFHIFKTRAEARSWIDKREQTVKKVRFKDFLAEGMGNNNRRIIVAKEIIIL